ncbi:MAG: succinate dehydrogenase assembly factor 4 [Parvularculales bacterium]
MDNTPNYKRHLSAVAQRALQEAQERARSKTTTLTDKETGGPTGPEPTHYGDWERKGIASDF